MAMHGYCATQIQKWELLRELLEIAPAAFLASDQLQPDTVEPLNNGHFGTS